jgi:hypothetical protein
MKRYRIKTSPCQVAYFDILEEQEDGFQVSITRNINGYETVSKDFLDNNLFDLCLKTGYISEIDADSISAESLSRSSVA